MMTEKYPTWLIGHVKEWAEKRLPTVTLCSTTGNELLEVWYYGDLLPVKRLLYLIRLSTWNKSSITIPCAWAFGKFWMGRTI